MMLHTKYTDSAQFRCLEHLKETSLDLYLVHCGREHCPPSHVCALPRDEYILHFVLSGKGIYVAQGKTWQVSAGQMFLICPGEPVTYISDAVDPWYYTWVGFNGLRVNTVMNNMGFSQQNLVQSYHIPEKILAHISNMLDARHLIYSNDLRRKAELLLLFSDLIDDHNHHLPKKTASSQQIDYSSNTYLKHAIEYIQTFYHQGINVSDIAEYIGLSRTYLNQTFQKELGISVQKFLIDYRLHKAANLLLGTSHAVGEIANEVGYEDALAFSKAFKKKFGTSPKNYREQKEEMDKFTEKQI